MGWIKGLSFEGRGGGTQKLSDDWSHSKDQVGIEPAAPVAGPPGAIIPARAL